MEILTMKEARMLNDVRNRVEEIEKRRFQDADGSEMNASRMKEALDNLSHQILRVLINASVYLDCPNAEKILSEGRDD